MCIRDRAIDNATLFPLKREDIMLLFKLVNEFQEKTSLIVTANYSLTELSLIHIYIEAQARFLRAYAYYCLATRWDGVPIIKDNTLENVKRDKQRCV